MQSPYLIRSNVRVLADSPQQIDFHIRTGDYFSFLATLMGFMEETVATCGDNELIEKHKKLARELRHDLRYVQANYSIIPRPLGDIQTIRPSGNLLSR